MVRRHAVSDLGFVVLKFLEKEVHLIYLPNSIAAVHFSLILHGQLSKVFIYDHGSARGSPFNKFSNRN